MKCQSPHSKNAICVDCAKSTSTPVCKHQWFEIRWEHRTAGFITIVQCAECREVKELDGKP